MAFRIRRYHKFLHWDRKLLQCMRLLRFQLTFIFCDADIEQILMEAQHRWLRPAEICEILKNYKKFHIAPEPAHMPPSGSLFLFDRKVLRYFRKDGHNWRKKKDGKTVKEAHEKLKVGGIDVLHCYYAHGEENENFQRRSYWLLEDDLSHIVLVHYREVKGNRTNFNRIKENEEAMTYSQDTEGRIPNSEMESSLSSSFHPNNGQISSQTTDSTSLNSVQASDYEDAESVYNHQASSQFQSFLEPQQSAVVRIDGGFSDSYVPLSHSNDYNGKPSGSAFQLTQPGKDTEYNDAGLAYKPLKNLDIASWEDVLGNLTTGVESVQYQPQFTSTHDMMGQPFNNSFLKRQEFEDQLPVQEGQASEGDSSHLSKWPLDQKLHPDLRFDIGYRIHEQEVNHLVHPDKQQNNPIKYNQQTEPSNGKDGYVLKVDSQSYLTLEGKSIPSAMRQHLLDASSADEGLKKLDSFNRWMSKELGDVDESLMQPSSGADWDAVEGQNGVDVSVMPSQGQLDTFFLGPSLSQDQLFSIIDFSPNWAYEGLETEVLIMGKFLKSRDETKNYKWSCMFGEVEVPAQVIADGVLRCHTPIHNAGRVPFYVTCSNRVACSEVREFEYRVFHIQDLEIVDHLNSNANYLIMRFDRLLCLGAGSPHPNTYDVTDVSEVSNKINSLLKEDNEEWDQMLRPNSEEGFVLEKFKEQLLQKPLKEKLRVWLLQKVAEGGKGPSILDEDGQGVIHFAAALGCDWALEPTIIAGVSVNFRDVNGWTALHWAASYGREHTVASLISLGASPGALTDPTPEFPLGRTAADLASANGHKGISGYLAEADLSSQLVSLSLDKQDSNDNGDSRADAIQKILERNTAPPGYGDTSDGTSMKDSLAAVRNATQAAARIHQAFRVQSFQQRQLKEYGDDKFGMSDERALSLIAVKSKKPGGHHDEHVHAAAIRIQNKFRGWKGRKEFLIIRQRIVKIQAHVRGHQVRKNYRTIVWSVGILEKVILRWRRKGSGLRGFKREALIEGPSMHAPPKEDDYDFLKQGRKQTEERLQKALARVKSMAQNPAGRDQYSRMKNVVNEIQEKVMYDKAVMDVGVTDLDEDLIDLDLEKLLDDDIFMHTAF
ncbi:IQ motif, EF-hand binding site [Corchorus capsularis]|uniref:IQ motif, EF-hand binding site n=1 Tax=Corchorus capsularis TaxID=210143 RepID=A0A1R3GDG7_COCAP|nr:IQ motif, EF-hand binding site [Corchorus capsularis]